MDHLRAAAKGLRAAGLELVDVPLRRFPTAGDVRPLLDGGFR